MEKSQRHTRRTSEQMFPLVERYESSGQLQKEFCKSHDINIGTFQYWLTKYRELNSTPSSNSFQQINVMTDQPDPTRSNRHIEIRTPSGVEIKIPLD